MFGHETRLSTELESLDRGLHVIIDTFSILYQAVREFIALLRSFVSERLAEGDKADAVASVELLDIREMWHLLD